MVLLIILFVFKKFLVDERMEVSKPGFLECTACLSEHGEPQETCWSWNLCGSGCLYLLMTKYSTQIGLNKKEFLCLSSLGLGGQLVPSTTWFLWRGRLSPSTSASIPFSWDCETAADSSRAFPSSISREGKCFQKLIILGLNSIPIARVRGKISCPQISYPGEDRIWWWIIGKFLRKRE